MVGRQGPQVSCHDWSFLWFKTGLDLGIPGYPIQAHLCPCSYQYVWGFSQLLSTIQCWKSWASHYSRTWKIFLWEKGVPGMLLILGLLGVTSGSRSEFSKPPRLSAQRFRGDLLSCLQNSFHKNTPAQRNIVILHPINKNCKDQVPSLETWPHYESALANHITSLSYVISNVSI